MHQALGVYSGEVTVSIGGDYSIDGVELTARPGDNLVLPAIAQHALRVEVRGDPRSKPSPLP